MARPKKTKVELPVSVETKTEPIIEFKKYKVTSPFEMGGQIMNPNQAIMLSDVLAKKYEGHIKLM